MSDLDSQVEHARRQFRARRARLAAGAAVAVLLLAVVLPLAYFGSTAAVRVSPPAAVATVTVTRGAGRVAGGRVWFVGDGVLLRVQAPGYLARDVAVAAGARAVTVALAEAPAAVVVTTHPALAQTRWRVNGADAGAGARFERVLPPGVARITADHAFYRVAAVEAEVREGQGAQHHLELTPVAGRLDIRSQPAGARVSVDGAGAGTTPVNITVAGGRYQLQVELAGHQTVTEEVVVTRRAREVKRDYRLTAPTATAHITVAPPGGTLRVGGVATPPGTVQLAPGRAHRLHYAKPGYFADAREVTLRAGEVADIAFELQAEFGEVSLLATPAADITVNGKPAGATPQTLQLQALAQRIVLSRPGYRAVTVQVMPSAHSALLIDEVLLSEFDARMAEATPVITAAPGTAAIKMQFFDPRGPAGRFTMGAPRGEKHRRANEFQRRVELSKPFYAGVSEVTEAQFANYQPGGGAGGDLPARNVSWLEAAAFCNWLSAKDGLQPAYQISGGRLRGFDPTADGYRLLSEAEWEWLARVAGRSPTRPAKFVWGFDTTIPTGSGNFADESAKGSVAQYIPRYNDGFAGVAPVASFAADAAGLYDMAGNVSEWTHDRYILQPPGGEVARNPFGGENDSIGDGGGRVIKGGNFRTASNTGLRASFREGIAGARDDVGFRIARYLYGKE